MEIIKFENSKIDPKNVKVIINGETFSLINEVVNEEKLITFDSSNISNDIYSPVINGEINHNFLKGCKIRNIKSNNPDEEFINIGLYQGDEGTTNFNRLCFAVKKNGDSRHSTSWWFSINKVNKNIIFSDPKAQEAYLSSNYRLLDLRKH